MISSVVPNVGVSSISLSLKFNTSDTASITMPYSSSDRLKGKGQVFAPFAPLSYLDIALLVSSYKDMILFFLLLMHYICQLEMVFEEKSSTTI